MKRFVKISIGLFYIVIGIACLFVDFAFIGGMMSYTQTGATGIQIIGIVLGTFFLTGAGVIPIAIGIIFLKNKYNDKS